MKYTLLGLAMLGCFALANGATTAAPLAADSAVTAPSDSIADDGDEATTCGGNVCGKGTYCCNASCGTCVPKGMSCTQQSCN